MNMTVSIVIPVYNVEEYLEEAVNSVLSQTFQNLEIILVDDGSTDKSGIICDTLKERDSRIIVIHDKNEGLSEARNRGIRIAKGDFICFLDSDDYLDTTFVQKMMDGLESSGADMAICPLWKVYPDAACTGSYIDLQERKYTELCTDDAYKLVFTKSHIGVYVCNKVYRTTLFKDISFPYGRYYEDSGTTYKLINLCKKIVYYPEPLYFYRINRPGSIVSDASRFNKLFDKCMFLEEMDVFFKNKNLPVQEAFLSKYISDIMGILEDCAMQSQTGSLLWHHAKKMFLKYKEQILKNRMIPIGRKMKGICLIMGDRPFFMFCKAKKLLVSSTLLKGYDV